ncbi:hypothetical protein WKW80_09295 [Variovorax humicola]|uniref:Uncharacterized protein n=1 Tax=Variovorax humicola TaxID=1769758 RepID=A0ABU8VWT7_9BURK
MQNTNIKTDAVGTTAALLQPRDRVLYVNDENGQQVAHVKLSTGEYVTVDADAWDMLRAVGCSSGWARTANPATGKTSITFPSRSPRMPMVFLSRLITGASRRQRVIHTRGPFDLRRSSLKLVDLVAAEVPQ